MKKKQRWNLLAIVFIGGVLALAVFLSGKQTSTAPKAAPSTVEVDAQTGEFYDLWFDTDPVTITRSGSGPVYLAQTKLTLGGPRLQFLRTLYGFKQTSEAPYAEDQMTFSFQDTLWGRFTTTARLSFSNCIDLYSSQSKVSGNYVATLCYVNSFVRPSATRNIIYSPAANPFVRFDYSGTRWTTIQSFSTAFNKYISKPVGYEDGPLMTRVNWFTVDTSNSSLSSFKNATYSIQGLTQGLSTQQEVELCQKPIDNPQKYFKFGPNGATPKPEGGENVPVTRRGTGGCSFELDAPYLKSPFVSLYMTGGIPLPTPTLSPTPIPTILTTPTPGSVSCTPRPACLDARPRPCRPPEPIGGWCPRGTGPSPTRSPKGQ